jgi:hypothetical protein
MTDCPNCEYHRKRAQRWREEAYKQSGYPLPEREWVGLTDEEKNSFWKADQMTQKEWDELFADIEVKLKEKNNG